MNKRETFRCILRYLRSYAPLLVVTVLCALVSVAAQLAVPFFVGRAIDYILGAGQVDFTRVYYTVGGFAACVLLAALSQKLLGNCVNSLCYRLVRDLRRDASVLDDGGMVGIGTHEELLANCPVYREIAASQEKEGSL